MTNLAKIKTTYHLWQNGIKPDKIASDLGVHRSTIYRWIYKLKTKGYHKMIQQYRYAKKRSREKTPGWIKNLICEIRDNNHGLCGQKIVWILEHKHNIKISLPTVYRILRARGKVKRKYQRDTEYLGRCEQGLHEGNIIQCDTVMLGELVAFTFYDTYSKKPFVRIETRLNSIKGSKSLKLAYQYYKNIEILQRDGGPEFKKYFERTAKRLNIQLRTSRPYKKNDQSYIESFNRVLRKECVGWGLYKKSERDRLQRKVNKFLRRYINERPHLGLNMMTPLQFSLSHLT